MAFERLYLHNRMMRTHPRTYNFLHSILTVLSTSLLLSSCVMVGPDYARPPAPMGDQWIEPDNPAIVRVPADVSAWWTVFNDPALNSLIETAYRQNPSLQAAGLRVLEAQARSKCSERGTPIQPETRDLQPKENSGPWPKRNPKDLWDSLIHIYAFATQREWSPTAARPRLPTLSRTSAWPQPGRPTC